MRACVRACLSYLILRYEHDLVAALQANAMVGGDSASRGVVVGMVLGAFHGVESIPQRLRDGLNAWKRSEELLARLPLLQQQAGMEGETNNVVEEL